jgi:hypothetical protein
MHRKVLLKQSLSPHSFCGLGNLNVAHLSLYMIPIPCSALEMLLPLPRYLSAARNIESLPVGEGAIINTGALALRKVWRDCATWVCTNPCVSHTCCLRLCSDLLAQSAAAHSGISQAAVTSTTTYKPEPNN